MPSLLIDIAANVAKLATDMNTAQSTVKKFAKETEQAFGALKGVLGAAGLGMGLKETITAYMEAEKASLRMAMAMKNQGDYSKAALNEMRDYSAEIQRTTGFEDDLTLSIMGNLKSYGMTNDEVRKATRVALDFAAAKEAEGMSVNTAADLIGKAYAGNTSTLSRYGIVIDESIKGAERFTAVMEQLNQRFGGAAQAQLLTYAGQWQKLKADIGDVAEVIGLTLLKSLQAAIVGFNSIAVSFYSVLDAILPGFGDIKKEAIALMNKNTELFLSFDNVEKSMENMNVQGQRTVQVNQDAEKAVKDTTTALDALEKVMAKYGEDRLKIGKDEYTESLKKEQATIEDMERATKAYLSTINSVYTARIAGEKEIARMLELSGASPKKVLEAQSAILKLEKEASLARRDTWKTYYAALQGEHSKATDLMKSKTAELVKLESELAAMRNDAVSVQMSQYEKLWAAQGKANDDHLLWDKKRQASEELYQSAMNTSGQERIKFLNEYIKSQEQMVGKEFEYSTRRDIWTGKEIEQKRLVGSEEEKILKATENINRALNLRELEQNDLIRSKEKEISATDEWKSALEEAMASAKKMTDEYKGQIDAIAQKITEMDKKIALTVDTEQAKAALTDIQAMLNGIKDKTVTVSVNYAMGGGGGISDLGGPGEVTIEDAYDPGSPFGVANGAAFNMGDIIPFASGGIFSRPTYFPMAGGRTGMMGESGPEAVVPLKRGSDGKLGIAGGVVYVAPGAITINGINKTSAQIVDEIWTPLMGKMRQKGARV